MRPEPPEGSGPGPGADGEAPPGPVPDSRYPSRPWARQADDYPLRLPAWQGDEDPAGQQAYPHPFGPQAYRPPPGTQAYPPGSRAYPPPGTQAYPPPAQGLAYPPPPPGAQACPPPWMQASPPPPGWRADGPADGQDWRGGTFPPVPQPRQGHARGRGSRPRAGAGRKRPGLVLAVLALALAGVAVSAAGLAAQILPRTFSAAQRQQIMAWEMGKRWRTWPAGEIFPKTVTYQVPGSVLGEGPALNLIASRVGIAHEARCRAATDAAVAKILVRHGCLAVLRATYDDATQSLAVTVGVAVLPGVGAANASGRLLSGGSGLSPGIRAVPFHRTVAARFGNQQRQLSLDRVAGPYLVFATVGYADGRRRQPGADSYAKSEMLSVAVGIVRWVASHLGASPPPPHCPAGPAC
jgi:hypothetical protein